MRLINKLFLVVFSFWSCNLQKQIDKKLITLTYNIHHGGPENSNQVNLQDIADVIQRSKADVVALQEVDVLVPRSGGVHQAEELAKLLGMHYYFSKSIDFSGGQYGVAILSKYPLFNTRKELLPMPVASEQRSVAMATVNLPGNVSIEFGATHLDLKVDNRIAQSQQLNAISENLAKPFFVGGDYNAIPTSKEMKILKEEFHLSCMDSCALSFPVRNPDRAIDFVVYNKIAASMFKLVEAYAMKGEYASDHLPVVAVFSYR